MTLSADRFNNYFLIGITKMTDNASFEFLRVNDNLVKISIKISLRLNERKLSLHFFGLEGRR